MVAKFLDLNMAEKKPENIDIYSGTKREPILFFYGWTMLIAVTAKKDC